MCNRCVEWGGKRWHSYSGKYYEYRGTRSLGRKDRDVLHRAVYRDHHGSIPEGHDIHHIDGDCFNNDVQNLEAITRSEHMRLHRIESPIPKAPQKPLVETKCESCGTLQWRRKLDAKCFCKKCASRRAEEARKKTKQCEHCGAEFRTRTGTLCSQRCVNLATSGATRRILHRC